MRHTHNRHAARDRQCCEHLEPRRLLAAAVVTAVLGDDGSIVITGTRRPDEISVVEHAPGTQIYDVLANGTAVGQFGAANAIRLDGRGGNDVVSVAPGITLSTNLLGGPGNDRITGGSGTDTIDGGKGRDDLSGGAGDDVVSGGQGKDSLHGGDGSDRLDGGNGRDDLAGDAGDDVITGGTGRDSLEGGDGNDSLDGGSSRDAITSGPGVDHVAATDRDNEILDQSGEDFH